MPKISLWHPVERPSYVLYSLDGSVLEVGPTLAADEVLCDLCNSDVPLNPAPMIDAAVLCLGCLAEIVPDWEEQISCLLKTIWRMQMEAAASE